MRNWLPNPRRWLDERRGLRDGRLTARGAARLLSDGAVRPRGRDWLWPLGMALLILILHLILFPPLPRFTSDFPAMGEIAEEEVRAPITFRAPLLGRDVEMRRLEKVVVEPPVLRELLTQPGQDPRERFASFRTAVREQRERRNAGAEEDAAALLALQYPQITEADLRRLIQDPDAPRLLNEMERVLSEVVGDGVVDMLPPGSYTRVWVVRNKTETLREVGEVTPQSRISERLTASLRSRELSPVDAVWAAGVLRPFVIPNVVFDAEESRQRQAQVRDTVATEREFIRGERIVDRGVRVTEQQALYLQKLADTLAERGGGASPGQRLRAHATRTVLLLLILGLYGWLAVVHFAHVLVRRRILLALGISILAYLGGAAFALHQPGLGAFAVPVILLSLLATVLFRDRVGYATSLLAVGLLLMLPDLTTGESLALLLLGTVTVVAVRRIQKRSQFYQTIGLLTLLSLVLITVVRTAEGGAWSAIGAEYLVGLFTPILLVAFALFLLPVIEPLVGVVSDLTLLELSDLNHPLLQRMALEAPGSFHHSQVVGQLGETAARAIRANALLVRVGALFHDIGKMAKPEYYVENQHPGGGRNRHDELSPSMSALVIAAHVKDGMEMGRKWRLPRAVIDFIPEHHGTQVMEYFYHKALEGDGNETVKVDDFRYPGPKPQSRETAVLMLADAVEAATRSLAKPTPGRIREITKQIVDKRMLSGELDECNLTLADLARIREAFIPLLTGIHHARIAYPGQREDGRSRERGRERGDRREPRREEQTVESRVDRGGEP
ncbi:MAG: HDIG domain-containing protein [Candidatus Krumholzibacteriia bacterium]